MKLVIFFYFQREFGTAVTNKNRLSHKHTISQNANTLCISSSVTQSKVIGHQQFVFTADRKWSVALSFSLPFSLWSSLLRRSVENH